MYDFQVQPCFLLLVTNFTLSVLLSLFYSSNKKGKMKLPMPPFQFLLPLLFSSLMITESENIKDTKKTKNKTYLLHCRALFFLFLLSCHL